MRLLSPVLFVSLLIAPVARASSICDYYRTHQRELYKLVCSTNSASSKPAGANSTFTSAFNINSASLPTEPSTYGLEMIGSQIRGGDGTVSPTFSIVKGFRKFGTGISTGSNATFYGDDILQRIHGSPLLTNFDPTETEKGSLPNLNIGTALDLYTFQRGPNVRMGISARYNKITDSWGGGPALLLNWTRFSLGAGFTRERVTNTLTRLTFTSTQASFRIWLLEFEYNRLTDNSGFKLDPIQILTTTITVRQLLLTAAARRLNYLQAGTVTQWHYAAQYLFTANFSGGMLFNYIPGASSIGIQYFL